MKELEQIFKHIKIGNFYPSTFSMAKKFFIDAAVKALENDVLTEDEKLLTKR